MPELSKDEPAPEGGSVFESDSPDVYRVVSARPGPAGSLPVTAEDLIERPSGDLFGWTQDVGMGWNPAELRRPEVLILSTQGGIRLPDGTPLALGYHTGHYEVGLLMQAAAEELRERGCIPFAGYCTDPCDGRSQGTTGMLDSLPYRNDAAIVLRRLIRSLPRRQAVVGVATCDKGLPAMLMALAGSPGLPVVLVPGGVTLPASDGEDAGRAQTIGARFANRQITLEEAADIGCRACASPGGGCQFLGTAATSQVVSEALGLSVPHSALAPSGQPVWLDAARRSARAVLRQKELGLDVRDLLTDVSVRNAMVSARGLRRLDEPSAAPARGGARGGVEAADSRRLDGREPARAAARGRAAERAAHDRARLPRGRSARGHAALEGTRVDRRRGFNGRRENSG